MDMAESFHVGDFVQATAFGGKVLHLARVVGVSASLFEVEWIGAPAWKHIFVAAANLRKLPEKRRRAPASETQPAPRRKALPKRPRALASQPSTPKAPKRRTEERRTIGRAENASATLAGLQAQSPAGLRAATDADVQAPSAAILQSTSVADLRAGADLRTAICAILQAANDAILQAASCTILQASDADRAPRVDDPPALSDADLPALSDADQPALSGAGGESSAEDVPGVAAAPAEVAPAEVREPAAATLGRKSARKRVQTQQINAAVLGFGGGAGWYAKDARRAANAVIVGAEFNSRGSHGEVWKARVSEVYTGEFGRRWCSVKWIPPEGWGSAEELLGHAFVVDDEDEYAFEHVRDAIAKTRAEAPGAADDDDDDDATPPPLLTPARRGRKLPAAQSRVPGRGSGAVKKLPAVLAAAVLEELDTNRLAPPQYQMLAADSDEAKRVLRSSRVRGVPSYVDGDGVVVPQIDVKEYSGKVILLERSDEVSSRFKRRGVRRMIELKEAATSAAELVRLGWRHEKGDVAVAVAYAPGDARRREICIGPKGETTEHVAVYESEIVLISVQAQDRASGASSFKAVGWIENMDEKGVSDTLFALQRGGASQLQHNAQVGVMICVGAKDKYGNAGHYVGDFNETIGMKIALQSARLCSVEMALLPAAALQRARRSKALERDRKKRGLGSSQLVEGFGDANPTTAEAMAYTRGYGVVMHSENGGCLEAIAWAGGQAAAEKLASPLVFALPDAGLLLDVGAAAAAAGRVALLSGDFVHGTLRVFDDEGEVVKHEVTATALLSKIHIQEPAPR